MFKMPGSGKDHGKAQPVAGFYGVFIVDRAAGLNNGLNAGGGGGLYHIGEGEEGVGGEYPCGQAVCPGAAFFRSYFSSSRFSGSRLYRGRAALQGLLCGPDAVRLASAYTRGGKALDDHYGVRLHESHGPQAEDKVRDILR